MQRKLILALAIGWSLLEGSAIAFLASAGAQEVELLVRGPDDKPLADRRVTVRTAPPSHPPSEDRTAQADAAGTIRFAWPAGRSRLLVEAPGIGYVTTTGIDVAPEGVTRPRLPAMVPYGHIEGIVPDEWIASRPIVELEAGPRSLWRRVQADERGRFEFRDRYAGTYRIGLRINHATASSTNGYATVVPRATVSPEFHAPIRRSADDDGTTMFTLDHWCESPPTEYHGTTSDEDGRPLAGAEIFVWIDEQANFMHPRHEVRSTVSDSAGRWKIVMPAVKPSDRFRVEVVARKPGFDYTRRLLVRFDAQTDRRATGRRHGRRRLSGDLSQ